MQAVVEALRAEHLAEALDDARRRKDETAAERVLHGEGQPPVAEHVLRPRPGRPPALRPVRRPRRRARPVRDPGADPNPLMPRPATGTASAAPSGRQRGRQSERRGPPPPPAAQADERRERRHEHDRLGVGEDEDERGREQDAAPDRPLGQLPVRPLEQHEPPYQHRRHQRGDVGHHDQHPADPPPEGCGQHPPDAAGTAGRTARPGAGRRGSRGRRCRGTRCRPRRPGRCGAARGGGRAAGWRWRPRRCSRRRRGPGPRPRVAGTVRRSSSTEARFIGAAGSSRPRPARSTPRHPTTTSVRAPGRAAASTLNSASHCCAERAVRALPHEEDAVRAGPGQDLLTRSWPGWPPRCGRA